MLKWTKWKAETVGANTPGFSAWVAFHTNRLWVRDCMRLIDAEYRREYWPGGRAHNMLTFLKYFDWGDFNDIE